MLKKEDYKIKFVLRGYRNPLNAHQEIYAKALTKGMAIHGHKNTSISPVFIEENDTDLVCVWAHKTPQIFQHQRKRDKPYLIMERSYIGDRFDWVSLAYNGLNGRGNFLNDDITDMSRWKKHFAKYVKPWKINKEGYVLVIGQMPGDWAIQHVNINEWYVNTIRELNSRGLRVIFRPNPLDKHNMYLQNKNLKFIYDTNKTLEESLSGARCCVAFSSNSTLIAAINGCPSVAVDPISMTYGKVSATDLGNLDYAPNRNDWFAKLAYCQWLPSELEDGSAWKHLKKGLDIGANKK